MKKISNLLTTGLKCLVAIGIGTIALSGCDLESTLEESDPSLVDASSSTSDLEEQESTGGASNPAPVATSTPPATLNNTLGVGATLAKHDIFIDGGVAYMSDYLATLERKIDSQWMNGKTANSLNPSGAEWSNVLLETSDGKRHAFQRTSTKTKYLVPSTTNSGDWKIRQKGFHSYLKNKPLQDGVISLAASQWLSDSAPWPKVSPPSGW